MKNMTWPTMENKKGKKYNNDTQNHSDIQNIEREKRRKRREEIREQASAL